MRTVLAVLVAALVGGAPMAFAQDARIDVHAKEAIASVSRTMTGACIEDVNHEIYGGLYSQMIFGESFQEPAFTPPVPVNGFRAYGGAWTVKGAELWADAGQGPKLVADRPEMAEGEGHKQEVADRRRPYVAAGKPPACGGPAGRGTLTAERWPSGGER